MLKIYLITNSTLIPETNAYEVVGVRQKYQEKSSINLNKKYSYICSRVIEITRSH